MLNENINDLTENKLILLFILNNTKIPLTNTQITEIVLEEGIINYFISQQYLADLINSKQIETYEKEGKEFYKLTGKGRLTLNYFENRIPDDKRENILKTIANKEKEFKRSQEIVSNYIPINENEYVVELKIIENDSPLIELKFSVGTKSQAKELCENWKLNSEKIYKQIISAFSTDED